MAPPAPTLAPLDNAINVPIGTTMLNMTFPDNMQISSAGSVQVYDDTMLTGFLQYFDMLSPDLIIVNNTISIRVAPLGV